MKNYNSTIAVISTPLISGAISIVRMSGPKAIEIADKVFSAGEKTPSSFPSRMMVLGKFKAKDFIEQCLCVVFREPNSYSGENMVEFQCHGGVVITKGIYQSLLLAGAKPASAGELTKRAFLNGKISLSGAEGMMDMINAQSEAEIRAGYSLLSGELSTLASSLQQKLVDLLSDIEVSLDYPEEDIEYITKEKTKKAIKQIKEKIDKQLSTRSAGKIIKEGVNIAILGRPNVGKSSLLNALLKDEKAIVTPIAGTTRDIVEGQISINGIKFNLFDTAGIHQTDDKVEQIGVDKAKDLIKSADIVLFVKEADKETKEDKELEKLIAGKKHLVLLNKSDLLGNYSSNGNTLRLSALNKTNISALEEKLYQMAIEGKNFGEGTILTSERHISCLQSASSHLSKALENIDNFSLDVITIDLNLAYSDLGQITGNTTGEDIINAIFSKFCLGK